MKKLCIAAALTFCLTGSAAAVDADIQGLRVSMPLNPMAETRINATLKKLEVDAECSVEHLRLLEAEYGDDIHIAGQFFYRFLTDFTYRDEIYTSVLVSFSEYSGGAHGLQGIVGYVFDTRTGMQMEFNDYGGYDPEMTKEFIRRELTARGIVYWPEALEEAMGDGNYSNFYLNEQGVPVVVFNPYEVAPYAAGILEVELPPGKG